MSFGILTLIVACGLAGPLLSAATRLAVPVVVGEIAAGVLVGQTGLREIDPADPTVVFLSAVGLRDADVRRRHPPAAARRRPAARAAHGRDRRGALVRDRRRRAAGCSPTPPASAIRPSSCSCWPRRARRWSCRSCRSAASPGRRCCSRPRGSRSSTSRASSPCRWRSPRRRRFGSAAAGCWSPCAAVGALRDRPRDPRRPRGGRPCATDSQQRGWALDLRLSLLVLFGLAALATKFGTSILIAGFAAGMIVALAGEPRRLTQQLVGLAEGFFVPFFFVTLGAKLNFRVARLVALRPRARRRCSPPRSSICHVAVARADADAVAGAACSPRPSSGCRRASSRWASPSGS